MTESQEAGILVLRPEGQLGLQQGSHLLQQIRQAETGVEFDLSRVDFIDVPILQLILVTVASMRQRGKTIVVGDSDTKVLRSALASAGIRPELAGLAPGLTL